MTVTDGMLCQRTRAGQVPTGLFLGIRPFRIHGHPAGFGPANRKNPTYRTLIPLIRSEFIASSALLVLYSSS